MKTFALFLLCTVFALSSAKPPQDYISFFIKEIEKQMSLKKLSMATVQEKSGEEICQSARYSHKGVTTYVHVCESGMDSQGMNEYCFVSNGLCCVPPSETFPPSPVEAYTLKLSDQVSTSVNFYSSGGSRGVCYDIENEAIEGCSGCRQADCVASRCTQNTLTGSMDSCNNDGCVCKEGFAPPDCCNCDLTGVSGRPHYLDPVTNKCTPYCRNNCPQPTLSGCDKCTVGYKPRDCCQCEDGYFDKQGICTKPVCENNVELCTGGVCTCDAGYMPQDCCNCAPGYYKDKTDNTCKLPCVDNVDECVNGECSCKPGYLSPDCCECDKNYYKDPVDKKCKLPECPHNLKAPCVDGACTCKDGYLPQDCCKCAPGYYKDGDECKLPCDTVETCVGGVCTCQKNYVPPDCCDCEKDLYKGPDGKCLAPCVNNIVSCTRGVCTCKSGFSGDDCCTESCTPAQDVYFLIDATSSYTTQNFGQTQYSTQLMISALNPGSSATTGTRLALVMYPTLKGKETTEQLRNNPRTSVDLLDIGVSCTEAVGKFNNLIDGFLNTNRATPVSPYLSLTKSRLTYPATAFELLNKKLDKAIRDGEEKADRRRVVIVITDGVNDEYMDTAAQQKKNPKLEEQIKKLGEITKNTNVIAAGNDGGFGSDINGKAQFMKDLKLIAGKNVVVDSDALKLAQKLIQKMIDLNAICKADGEEILKRLQDSNEVKSFYYCMLTRDPKSTATSVCQRYCKGKTPEQCRAPPQCPGGPAGEKNPWYVGSKNYNHYGDPAISQEKMSTKSELQKEMLAVVEELLLERIMSKGTN